MTVGMVPHILTHAFPTSHQGFRPSVKAVMCRICVRKSHHLFDVLGSTQPRFPTEAEEGRRPSTPRHAPTTSSPSNRRRDRRAAHRRHHTPSPREDVLRLLRSDHHRDEDVARLRLHLDAVQHNLNDVRFIRNEIQRRLRLKEEQRRRRRSRIGRDRDAQRARRHWQEQTWCRHKNRCLRRGCPFRHPQPEAPGCCPSRADGRAQPSSPRLPQHPIAH